MHVSQSELAALFRVTTRTIQRWGPKGLDTTRTGDGATYDLVEAIAWRLDQARTEGEETGRREGWSEGKEQVDIRKATALARRYELENAERESVLVNLDEVEEDLACHLSRIRAGVTALVGRLVPRLGRYKPSEALAIVEPIVHDLLESLSRGEDVDADEEPEAA